MAEFEPKQHLVQKGSQDVTNVTFHLCNFIVKIGIAESSKAKISSVCKGDASNGIPSLKF